MRRALSRACLFAVVFATGAALGCAGSDDSQTGKWSLDRRDFEGDVGLPFLSPANDSRLNLRLLMLDVRPQAVVTPPTSPDADISSSALFTRDDFAGVFLPAASAPSDGVKWKATVFSDEEGTRCVSNAAGADGFDAAVQAEPGLSADERKALTDAREALKASCDSATPYKFSATMTSAGGRDFAAYLVAAADFYNGDFDAALTGFKALAKTDNAWLREAARYMVARALLNKAEVGAFEGFDGAPEPKVTDRDALAAAEAELNGYLSAYPQGRFAASARGLLRRVDWLGGDKAQLAAEYGWQIAHIGQPSANLDPESLAQEIDSKHLDGKLAGGHDAYLLAVEDLMRMRSGYAAKPPLTARDLDAQGPDFAGHDALLIYLKAARAFYVDGDAAAALAALGPPPTGPLAPPYLAFSREVLRGEALMSTGRLPDAVAHWRSLLALAAEPWQKEAVELGLATALDRSGAVNKIFEGDTRISSSRLRALVLRYEAGPILLREAIANPLSTEKEKALARFTLLYKEATRGQYKNFLRDFSPDALKGSKANRLGLMNGEVFLWGGSESPYKCGDLKSVATQLAADPGATSAQLCIAEFVRFQDLDTFESGHPAADELGGGKPIFPGDAYSRGEAYKAVVANAAAPDRDKAYALFRLINCYGPSGSNGCGGKDVAQAQRKAWFQALKTKYADTPWAKSLKYYW